MIRQYFSFFDQNRIYLPQPLCDLLEQFDRDLSGPMHSLWAFARTEEFTPEIVEKMEFRLMKAWDAIDQDVPRVRAAIENEFRKLLGVLPESRAD